MSEYFIRGIISFEFRKGDFKVRISPTTGFTSPETTSRAIAFPIPTTSSKDGKMNGNQETPELVHVEMAKLLNMTDKKYEVRINDYEIATALVAITGQQKIVELCLTDQNGAGEMTVVGFIFPAP